MEETKLLHTFSSQYSSTVPFLSSLNTINKDKKKLHLSIGFKRHAKNIFSKTSITYLIAQQTFNGFSFVRHCIKYESNENIYHQMFGGIFYTV